VAIGSGLIARRAFMHHGTAADPKAEKLYELIRDIKIAMMTTVEGDGTLHSRPMYSQQADDDGDLWFFTRLASGKTSELGRDNEVNLGYSDPENQHYVSISGKGEIVRDRSRIEEKWSEGLRVWFPKGKDDPDMALIRVKPVRGEYWDSPSSTVLHLYGYVKSSLTGKPPTELTEQAKVNLR
jgi:general stress protein 26